MSRILLLAVALAAIPITAIAQEAAPLTPEQMVDARQSKMGRGGGAVAALKQAADSADSDLMALAPRIEGLIRWGEEMPALFPVGTDVAGTDARAEVWSDAAGFQAAVERFQAATRALAAPAAAGDRPALLAAITAVRESCSGCHAGYKN